MTSMPQPTPGRDVTVGVDTHRDFHVAVGLDQLGARLGELTVPATRSGYVRLHEWASGLGAVVGFGITSRPERHRE